MNRYNATVHREGDWWVIDVDGVGVTQAKRLDKVEHMARDLVAAVLDVDYDTVQVDVTFDLKADLEKALAAARAAGEAAKAAQKLATDLARAAVTRLQNEKLSLRDIAKLTGVSFQRVHQILEEAVTSRSDVSGGRELPRMDMQFQSDDVEIVLEGKAQETVSPPREAKERNAAARRRQRAGV